MAADRDAHYLRWEEKRPKARAPPSLPRWDGHISPSSMMSEQTVVLCCVDRRPAVTMLAKGPRGGRGGDTINYLVPN